METLAHSEDLCAAAELLSWSSVLTGSEIDRELAEWQQLLADIDALETRLHAFVVTLEEHRVG